MFAPLSASLLLALATATAPPAPLHEIGRDRAPAGVCGSLVVHANAAIAAELRERQWLGKTTARLRTLDLEGNVLARRNALSDLTGLAGELHDTAERGDDEIRRLGEAGERIDGAHRAAIRRFSDALGAAFAEHRHVAADLAALVNYLDYLTLHEANALDRAGTTPTGPFDRFPGAGGGSSLSSPYQSAGSPNRMARAAAAEYEARVPTLDAADGRAAASGEEAVTGCS